MELFKCLAQTKRISHIVERLYQKQVLLDEYNAIFASLALFFILSFSRFVFEATVLISMCLERGTSKAHNNINRIEKDGLI